MKKIKTFLFCSFFVLISCSLFSCKSTKIEVPEELTDSLAQELADGSDGQNEQTESETTEETASENSEEETGSDKNELSSQNFAIPQDFDEPAVEDIELPPEPVIEEPEPVVETEPEPVVIKEEPVIADETLLPAQEPVNTNQNETSAGQKTDADLEQLNKGQETQAEEPQKEELAETQEQTQEPELPQEPEPEPEPVFVPVPSRSVTLRKGENLIVTYPGSGWIYMGSTSEYNILASKGRKLGSTDTKFTLMAKDSGTQIHHFYKVDNLTGEYIDDYLEVIVQDKKGSSKTTVNAPDYASIIPPKPETPAKASIKEIKTQEEPVETPVSEPAVKQTPSKKTEPSKQAEPAKKTETPKKEEPKPVAHSDDPVIQYYVQTSEPQEAEPLLMDEGDDISFIDIDQEEGYSNHQGADSELLLNKAQELYDSKDYEGAYLVLLDFFELAQDNRDKGLYLQGQILEADSSVKDIKNAVKAYKDLTDNYPASDLWDKANKRIIYLKRFYIEVR